jgi:hypothetical protein
MSRHSCDDKGTAVCVESYEGTRVVRHALGGCILSDAKAYGHDA